LLRSFGQRSAARRERLWSEPLDAAQDRGEHRLRHGDLGQLEELYVLDLAGAVYRIAGAAP
jgi:hypothetical protein